jgi:hypothetical protein
MKNLKPYSKFEYITEETTTKPKKLTIKIEQPLTTDAQKDVLDLVQERVDAFNKGKFTGDVEKYFEHDWREFVIFPLHTSSGYLDKNKIGYGKGGHHVWVVSTVDQKRFLFIYEDPRFD